MRDVRLERGTNGQRAVDVHDAADLKSGHIIDGPALIDGSDTTIWLPPGATGQVDDLGTFVMEVNG
jgi:N-methylhydantoinase A/oxoprolinase/acetone carboxylase beta subunit